MNGAESLVRTLVGGGVNVCFANPGTSEMHFVAALDRVCAAVAPADATFKYRVVSRATLDRRRKQAGSRLSAEESGRLARLARVWAIARDVWGGDEAARAFLFRPHMMLHMRAPIDLALGTDLGAKLVEDILGRLRHGTAA